MCLAIQTEAVMEPQIDNQLYDIPGFEGLYKITRDGKIYGVRQKHWRKLQYNADGYLQIGLYKHGKCCYYQVHRLVAITFIPNPNNLPVVNHINSIKSYVDTISKNIINIIMIRVVLRCSNLIYFSFCSFHISSNDCYCYSSSRKFTHKWICWEFVWPKNE